MIRDLLKGYNCHEVKWGLFISGEHYHEVQDTDTAGKNALKTAMESTRGCRPSVTLMLHSKIIRITISWVGGCIFCCRRHIPTRVSVALGGDT